MACLITTIKFDETDDSPQFIEKFLNDNERYEDKDNNISIENTKDKTKVKLGLNIKFKTQLRTGELFENNSQHSFTLNKETTLAFVELENNTTTIEIWYMSQKCKNILVEYKNSTKDIKKTK